MCECEQQEVCSCHGEATVEADKEHTCSCCQDLSRVQDEDQKDSRVEKLTLAVGAILFIALEIYHELAHLQDYGSVLLGILVLSYLILGGKVLVKAGKNLLHGRVFDENFLMSVATLGAFAIQQYPEAVGVMLFYRIGELFEDLAVARSRSQIMAAVDLRPEMVTLLQDDTCKVVAAEAVQVGDIVLVRPGDRVPLDGVVIEGTSRLDTAAITGEPVPVKVEPGTEILSGCVNVSGVLKVRVQKRLQESMVTRILESVENAAAGKPRIDRFITRFSHIYTPIVIGLAVFTALVIPTVLGEPYYPWIYTALTFLVMSCPCALVLSVPLAFFCGIGAASGKGILFKGGAVLEALNSVKTVVMDKTGTITKGNFVVQKIIPAGTWTAQDLLQVAASLEQVSTHPLAVSIVTAAKENDLTLAPASFVEEAAGKGIKAQIQGKTVLCGNEKFLQAAGVVVPELGQAAAGTQVLLAVAGVFAGCILVADTVKDDAAEAVAELKRLGVATAMLTGDDDKTAEAVAAQVGVEEVHARMLPQEKLQELLKIRARSGSVMFVGDGINDAPVLAGADVGGAMGSGADAAIASADVVFLNSRMFALPVALNLARVTMRIARQNVSVALAIKIFVFILGLTGFYASMWLAVFADTGVAMLCILNSLRVLYLKIA